MKTLTLLLILLICAAQTRVLAADGDVFNVGGVDFIRPDSWKSIPVQSGMRKAELSVVTADGTATVVFFFFGVGQGGDIPTNVQRWFRQFQEPPDKIDAHLAEKVLPGGKLHLAKARGTFLSGMPGAEPTPLPGYSLLGAIIERDGGDVFVKMTGPQKVVESASPEFVAMMEAACRDKK